MKENAKYSILLTEERNSSSWIIYPTGGNYIHDEVCRFPAGSKVQEKAAGRALSIMNDRSNFSDIISDGGMDPRAAYEEARRPDQDSIKEEIWNRFMENMKFTVKYGEEPILPSNFLGSVDKHREQFMKIDIRDLTK